MRAVGKALIGKNRLIDLDYINKIYVSPRKRAQTTLKLLLESQEEHHPVEGLDIITTEDIREWDYGLYEGKKTAEIRKMRADKGLDQDGPWSIWTKGCEEGESPAEVQARIDSLIEKIVADHRVAVKEHRSCDTVIVAHGHILRCFTLRWIKRQISEPLPFILEAGGTGVLSYEHNNCDEPALNLGGAFVISDEA
ncbi:hypothetical protein DV495_004932 [Geotrichum candidum]|nr:hypothetical protein DV454_004321 [Geotrichum candidum]KAF5118230.1 hypothetical protein DV495_004932 [Geotrichum candidum]KAF5119899.1 hypothetical protein DV452_001416 [Geotrichum candidum]KAF7499392.1 hypothetical protein DV113_002584 [Geotrichum candidum]KAI8131911.1 hypothetical protein DUD61_004424 [Geotrichum candidum]